MATLSTSLALAAALLAVAQDSCPNEGSRLVPGFWEHGPPLGCTGRPSAPAWSLWTPPHRQVVARPGYRRGNARVRPRMLVRYECTGSILWPIRIRDVRFLGYVFSVGQVRCAPNDPDDRSEPGRLSPAPPDARKKR